VPFAYEFGFASEEHVVIHVSLRGQPEFQQRGAFLIIARLRIVRPELVLGRSRKLE